MMNQDNKNSKIKKKNILLVFIFPSFAKRSVCSFMWKTQKIKVLFPLILLFINVWAIFLLWIYSISSKFGLLFWTFSKMHSSNIFSFGIRFKTCSKINKIFFLLSSTLDSLAHIRKKYFFILLYHKYKYMIVSR